MGGGGGGKGGGGVIRGAAAMVKENQAEARQKEGDERAEAVIAERKRHIAASGRQSTILAGENERKTLLGG